MKCSTRESTQKTNLNRFFSIALTINRAAVAGGMAKWKVFNIFSLCVGSMRAASRIFVATAPGWPTMGIIYTPKRYPTNYIAVPGK